MHIRKSINSDKLSIEKIHIKAFGEEKGPEIAKLTLDLLEDPTAKPLLSLVAEENQKLLGHVLFTKATISQMPENFSIQILAPLAILPEEQNKGIGGKLINEGLKILKESGVDLVFVLGHPQYYPKHGFNPAGILGYEAPYPIPDEVADAWMVQEISPGIIGTIKGKVKCSEILDQPQHWRE